MLLTNPLECGGNYISTLNDIKLVQWPLMVGLLHLVQRGGDWVGVTGRSSLYQMMLTAHLSTATVPITVLMYSGPLLCTFNVAIKG